MTIKCDCGNKGCTTEVFISEQPSSIDLIIQHTENGLLKESRISLSPNSIVQLSKYLKQSLMNIA